ncbi:hypothetical protein [Alloyangia pacifica]|uniref:Uncharacterized protein n=1 Tax=Alloyangia pacifica TaxID=311180 RepID=A0A1I6THN1_9RHOB|nr:hypothetical protein [Alloyangia pacifica]SDH17881.1 hypothetical protein SAMN04488245_106310 [Alloyangia pacifica]SFS88666.1 hypothetical protein SAMN04488050_10682 [Alloyangia pacifica]
MKRLALLTAVTTCTAVAAYAATEVLGTGAATVIEIEVAPHELAECRETLQQVASMPAVSDDGTPLLFQSSDDLPQVRCVASTV